MGSDRYLPFLPIILKWIQQTLDAHAHERRAVSSFNFPRLPHYFHSFLSGKSFLYVALAGNAVTARTVPLRNVQMASSNLPESIMPPERYRSSPSSTSYAKSSGEFCMTDSNSRAVTLWAAKCFVFIASLSKSIPLATAELSRKVYTLSICRLVSYKMSLEQAMAPPCRHLLDSGFRQMAAIPESAKLFMSGLIERARTLKKTVAFPEGTDARVLEAAARLAREGIVKPVLIGARPANAPEGVEFVDPANSPLLKKYAALYYERRRAKGTTQVEAAAVAKKPLYFAALMVGAGDADGSVGGAVNSTAETVRAALHAVG